MKCERCQRTDLVETDFPKNGNGGRRRQCCRCMREINAAWRRTNKDKVAVYNKSRPKRVRKVKDAKCDGKSDVRQNK